jgi:hypothetical protein
MQLDNNMFPYCSDQDADCAAHPEQPLLSILFTPVGTMLFIVDESTMHNRVVGTTEINNDISDVL